MIGVRSHSELGNAPSAGAIDKAFPFDLGLTFIDEIVKDFITSRILTKDPCLIGSWHHEILSFFIFKVVIFF